MEGCAEEGTKGLEELRKMGLPSKVLDQVGHNFKAVQLNSDPERWKTGSGLYGTTQSQTERTVRKRLLKYTTNTSKIHFLRVDDGSEYDSDESGEGNEENQMEE